MGLPAPLLPPPAPPPPPAASYDDRDPWDYTVDEVVALVATIAGDDVRESFQENDIDGAVFLNDMSTVVLKEELSIKSFGKRSKIMCLVSNFRNRSCKFRGNELRGAAGIALLLGNDEEEEGLIGAMLLPPSPADNGEKKIGTLEHPQQLTPASIASSIPQ